MKIYVVRHGQTDYNVKGIFQGHTDIPLNSVGIEQAKQTAEKFKGIKIDYLLSSPLTRAVQTAQYIQEIVKKELIIENRLIERSFGDMEGKRNREDWNIQMMQDFEKNYDYENVEPVQSMFHRVFAFLDEVKKKYRDKNIILVTHGAISQAIECYFHGMPEKADFDHLQSLALKNCEVRTYDIS